MPSSFTSSSDLSPGAHLRRALIFGLGVLALLVVLDRAAGVVLDRLFRQSRAGEMAGQLNLMLESAQDADIVILGSSRARHHYDPAVIEPMVAGRTLFNLGASGQELSYARVVQRLMFQNGARPSCFVLQLDHPSMFVPLGARVASLRPYAGRDVEVDAVLREQIPWFDLKRHFALWRFNSISLALLINVGKRDTLGQGFVPLSGNREVLQQFEERLQRLTPRTPLMPVGAEALDYVGRIITDAHAHGARVVLITGPRHDRNADGDLIFNPHRDHLREEVARAAAMWAVPYSDLHERAFPALQAAALWADPGHLNAEGAAVFSAIVADVIASGCAAP